MRYYYDLHMPASSVARGRPRKFKESSQRVTLTLPRRLVDLLRIDDPDLSRAVTNGLEPQAVPRKVIVDVMRVGRRESLIIINPTLLPTLRDCSFIRLAADRAFIALKPSGTLTDLALAVADRLEDADVTRQQRAALRALRRALRTWRLDRKVKVTHKAIVILDGADD
jgi:hypothetical protein